MVKYCVAYGCRELQRKGSGVQFHRFPFSRPEILKLWVRAIRRDKWSPTAYSTICSRHFTENCYQVRPGASVRLLKDDAVPSVFDFPKHLQKKIVSRRQLARKEPASVRDVGVIQAATHLETSPEAVGVNKGIQANLSSPTKINLRSRIRRLQMAVNRRNKKISSMTQLIDELKRKGHLNSDVESHLKFNFSGFPLHFILNEWKNSACDKQARRYTDIIKQFALILHFYSPKAYRYVRSLFSLPHPNCIRSWISSVNCEPGFISEVFSFLKENVEKEPCLKECALIFDSMMIQMSNISK